MASASEHIPLVELSGDARTRGLAYGRACRQRVADTWNYYAGTVFQTSKLTTADIERRAEQVRTTIGDFKGDYCNEIDAIAEAAGLPRWAVYALNARTEILNAKVGECTALFLPGTRTLGQTWDWLEPLEDLVVLAHHVYPDGHRILSFAEPGQLGKIGLNSAGLGVCLNFLVAPHGFEGLPVHVLVRALLECRSVDEARALLARVGLGKASHFLIGSADGRAISYEFAGTRVGEADPVDGVYAHTNHCIAPDRDPDGYVVPTSPERLAAARRGAAARTTSDGVAALKQVLDFDDGSASAIRVAYRPEPMLGGGIIGSCATLVMDLPAGALHLRKGPYADRKFALHRV